MSYDDWTLEQLKVAFALRFVEVPGLFAEAPALPPSDLLTGTLARHLDMLPVSSNQRMRAEFLVAPVLAELWALVDHTITVFSGATFNVDPQAGLMGVCDFLIAHVPRTPVMEAPVVIIGEAKRGDLYAAMPQSVAGMVAATRYNAQVNNTAPVGGALTDGRRWAFLRLVDHVVQIDPLEYTLNGDLPRILGILVVCVEQR